MYDTSPNLGLTHSCPEDLDLMSHVKAMQTFAPKDAQEFDKLLKENYEKLNYFRIF